MPMNKEATQLTDPAFVGHTEFIAALCGVREGDDDADGSTASGSLAVTHVSTHCSLADGDRAGAHRAGARRDPSHQRRAVAGSSTGPRIAVCGLNPHAGEHGLFGTEDIEHIAPAIAAAVAEGIDATGPHPADTVFFQAVHRGRYDAIVCMYHDQGHGPMKLLAFDTGVNVTLGLADRAHLGRPRHRVRHRLEGRGVHRFAAATRSTTPASWSRGAEVP